MYHLVFLQCLRKWFLISFYAIFLLDSIYLRASDSKAPIELASSNIKIERGSNLDVLDPHHLKFNEKLHNWFNEFNMGYDWGVAADYPWMPPLDVITGKGLAVYSNSGHYFLEVDARRDHADSPAGDWILLFNQHGDLVSDIIFGSQAEMNTHIMSITDLDHDEKLEWLMWGAKVLPADVKRLTTKWESIALYSEELYNDYHVKLYVMNTSGILEYKRGSAWKVYYQYAANEHCPFIGKAPYYYTLESPNGSEIRDQAARPGLCLTSLEATEDIEFISNALEKLQDAAKANWEIAKIANSLDKNGYPFLKKAMKQ